MQIPQSPNLSTNRLGKVFNNTVATYKFFWFLSILQIHAKNDNPKIDVWDIVIRMVANAWYPVHYFKLSFGKSDSLSNIILYLQQNANIPIDASIEDIIGELKKQMDKKNIREQIKILTLNVPYRFLKPWIDTSNDNEMVERSKYFENGCLYSLHKENGRFYIIINSDWNNYLHNHYNILVDFTYWNLTLFLQLRNPNVPAISCKLIRPENRMSLGVQHKFWDYIISVSGPIQCIYTGQELASSKYDLDHFIPWSFVSHNLNWNLIPVSGSINSSKSDKLPDLSLYLPKMADLHHKSLKIFLESGKNSKILEDYISLGYSAQDLAQMSDENFTELYKRTFEPITQIALNMGFEKWKYYE